MANMEARILEDFFENVEKIVATLNRLQGASETMLADMKENLNLKNLGERLADINRDLDSVTVKMETLDQEVLKGHIDPNEHEKERLREYKEQQSLLDKFLPAMMLYSGYHSEL